MNDNHEPDGLDVAVSHLRALNRRQDFFEAVARTMKNYQDALVSASYSRPLTGEERTIVEKHLGSSRIGCLGIENQRQFP